MGILSHAKRAINSALLKVGHRIDFDAIIPQTEHLVRHLERARLAPATIFDIGVADGTQWIYNAWPDASYFLFDPTPRSLPHMQALAKSLKATVVNKALGDVGGTVKLHVRPDHSGSSLYDEVGRVIVSETRPVEMARFDEVVPADFQRPALAKIDVQGAEMRVLKGMGRLLQTIDCVVVETSLMATLKGGPEFIEVVTIMKENGLVLFDIIGVLRRPLDNAICTIDAVFVQEDSPLRRDRRWAVNEAGA